MVGKDKLLHIFVCALITILVFIVISLKCYKKSKDDEHAMNVLSDQDNDNNDIDVEIAVHAPSELPNNSNERDEKLCTIHQLLPTRKYIIIACISGIVAMAIGIAKEISDEYNIIARGTASWGDILADFIGVMLGECVIVFVWFGWKLCTYYCLPKR